MEDQSYETALRFPTLPNWRVPPNWMLDDVSGMVGSHCATSPSMMVAPGSSEFQQVSDWNTQWMVHIQPKTQNYVQFLGESMMVAPGSSEFQQVSDWNTQWMVHSQPKTQNYVQFLGESMMVAPGSSEIQQVSDWNTQWMVHSQPKTQNYVQLLGESAYPGTVNKRPFYYSAETSSHGLINPSQEQYLMPYGEGNMIATYSNMEHQLSNKKGNWNKDYNSSLQTYAGSDATASKCVSAPRRRKPSDEKRYAADRNRRLRISKSLAALQELLPHLKKGDKEAFLDNVSCHIQHLQHQLKVLSQSRLGGESTSDTFMFLRGQGHYPVNEQMHNKPLEDIVDKMFKFDPVAATELLDSKGLLVLPVNFAEGLRDPVEMLDEHGITELDRIIAEQLKIY